MNKYVLIQIFVGFSIQQCLPEVALKSLGFTTIKQQPEKIDGAKYCTDRFKEWGICVPIEDLEAIIKKDKQTVED